MEFIQNIIASRPSSRLESKSLKSGGSGLPFKGPSQHSALYHITADMKSQHKTIALSNLKEALLILHLLEKARKRGQPN